MRDGDAEADARAHRFLALLERVEHHVVILRAHLAHLHQQVHQFHDGTPPLVGVHLRDDLLDGQEARQVHKVLATLARGPCARWVCDASGSEGRPFDKGIPFCLPALLCKFAAKALFSPCPSTPFPSPPQSWEFFEPKSQTWLAAQVPGCIHLDLRRHGLIPDPFYGANELDLAWIEREDWTYRAHFDVTKETLQHEIVELVADGLDTVAVVSLNGQPIGRSENMFTAVRWAVEDFLKVGRNELLVEFASPLRYVQRQAPARRRPRDVRPRRRGALIRKEQCSFGWDWGARFPTSGVWRDIRLEAWEHGALAGPVRVSPASPRGRQRVDLVDVGTVVEPHPEDVIDELSYREPPAVRRRGRRGGQGGTAAHCQPRRSSGGRTATARSRFTRWRSACSTP